MNAPEETSAALRRLRPDPSAPDRAYDIRIAADGAWYHEGRPIERPALVRLFASVLKRDEAGDYWLVTAAEQGRIRVDDAPFVVVEAVTEDGVIRMRTSLDRWITVDRANRLRVAVDAGSGEPRPYLVMEDGVEALIARSVFYHLAEMAEEVDGRQGVWSSGIFHPLDGPQDRPAS